MFFQKTAGRLLAGILAASAMITPALAVNGTINTGSNKLNLRADASTSSSVLAKIPGGSVVDVLTEDQNGWYQVTFQGKTGYVSSQYVDLQQVAAAAQPAAAAVEAAPAEETDQAVYGRVIASSLNVRSAPSTSAEKCGKLYAGRTVEILETLPGWYRVAEGYVSADYVSIVDASSDAGNQVVDLAMQYLGYPYVYGGSSPKGFDCSGFTSYIYKQFGITLNRSASGQLDDGTPVAMSELQPGDLVLFKKAGTGSKRASHVGIYIGGGQFIHSSTYGVGVIINDLDYAYYTTGFVGGRRLL